MKGASEHRVLEGFRRFVAVGSQRFRPHLKGLLMRTKTLALALPAAMLCLFAGAGPSTAAPPVITATALQGEAAIASFSRLSADGCIRTRMTVFANVNQPKSGTATEDRLATVTVSRLDECNDVFLILGFGFTTDLDLVVAKNLSEASVQFSLNFNNSVDGVVTPMTVDVSLVANGNKDTTVTRDLFRAEGITFSSVSKSKVSPADGTVTAALGQDLLFEDESPTQAAMASGTEMTRTIDRSTP